MAKAFPPSEELEQVRGLLVAARRSAVSSILTHKGPLPPIVLYRLGREIEEVQETIEAIDRAIADESKIDSSAV